MALSALPLSAATLSWSGASPTTGNWSDSQNWGFAGVPGNGDTLIFPASQPRLSNTNNIGGLTLNQIRFVGAGGGYAIYGNSLTLTNGIQATNTVGANTIQLSIASGTPGHLVNVVGGSLTLAGVLSGSTGLTKNGSSTLTLAGPLSNTYGGTTTVNAGLVELLKAGFPAATAIPGNLVIGDGSSAATVRNLDALEIADAANLTVNRNGTYDLNNHDETVASLTMSGGTVASGTATLTLNGNLTTLASSVSSTISGGLSFLGGLRTVRVADGGALYDLLLNAKVSDSGGGLLFTNDVAAGSFIPLRGSNFFTGPVTVQNVTLDVETPWALGTTAGGTTIGSDGTLWMFSTAITNESLTLESGATLVGQNNNTWSGPVTLNGPATMRVYASSAVLNIIGAITGTGGVTKIDTGILRYSGSSANNYGGATIINEGTLELNKTSGWAIGAGSLIIGDGVGGANADVVKYTGASPSEINTPVPITVNSSGLLDLNNISDGVSGSLTLNDGNVQTGSGTLSLDLAPKVISVSNSPSIYGNLSVGSGTCTIQGSGLLYLYANVSGTANIIKNDSVSIYLAGNNTFSGTFTANNSGYIYLRSDTALGSANGGTVLNDTTHLNLFPDLNITNEVLTLNSTYDPTIYVNGYTNIWTSTNFTLLKDASIQVITNGALELIGPISGAGGLTKYGPGWLRYSGANTYTGDTYVNEGRLELNSVYSIHYGTLYIGDGWGGAGADVVRYLRNQTIFGGSGGNNVVIRSSGRLDLNGFTDDVGPIAMDGGSITTGAGFLELFSPLTTFQSSPTNGSCSISGNLTIRENSLFSLTNDLSVSAVVGGTTAFSLTKNGANTMYLSSSNFYPGLTIVQEGILYLQNAWALGGTNNGTVVSNNATLAMLGANMGITNESLVLNGPGVGGWGALDAETSGTNFWTGPIAVNANSTLAPYGGATVFHILGPISGAGGVGLYGSGQLVLGGSSANTYSGITAVPSGMLLLNKPLFDSTVPGDLSITGGTVKYLNHNQVVNHSDVTINGTGALDLNTFIEGLGTISGNGKILLGTSGLDMYDTNNCTFAGVMSGDGFFRQFGSATIRLTGTNTYTDYTQVGSGKLQIDGYQPQSQVNVSAGATLLGSGTVGQIIAQGSITPGASPGILNSSNVTFSASGGFSVELTGPTPGTDYDQLNVRGTNNLGNATLNLAVSFAKPVGIGQQFVILNNDGGDPVVGTFNGLPNGSVMSSGGYGLRINYIGGDTNDVVLTLVSVPATQTASGILSGNSDGTVSPNECFGLRLVVSNQTAAAMTGITASLSSADPNAMVMQPLSAYPNAAASGRTTNSTLFQVSTLPSFPCGGNLNLNLTLTTASHGSFIVPVSLPTGSPSVASVRYDNNTLTNVPDVGTIDSTNIVGGWTGGPITKVVVSLWLGAQVDSVMNLSLIAPDGTTVDLSSGNGGLGSNFGTGNADASRTTFNDAAATSITAGSAPFVGSYRPEIPLAALAGTSPNGAWRLRIQDTGFSGNPDTLFAWSLFLYGTSCAPGGGACVLCPIVLTNTLTSESAQQVGRLTRNCVSNSCVAPKACPGANDSALRYYHAYSFYNGKSNACITVTLSNTNCLLMSAAYLGSFNPANLCANYLGDTGDDTRDNNGCGWGIGPRSYSINVPADSVFVVTVNEVGTGICGSPYSLTVSGGDCQPLLAIQPVASPFVNVNWPTVAGYQLHATPTLSAPSWNPVLIEPVAANNRFNVTNSMLTSSNRFYRLQKP